MESRRNNKTITGLRVGKSSSETIYSDLVPATDNYYDLGSTNLNWQDVYATRGNFNDSVGTNSLTSSTFLSTNATVTNLTVTTNLNMLANAASLHTLNVLNTTTTKDLNISNSTTTKDLNVTGTLTFASQPEFDGFVASGGVILKDGLLVRGGSTLREGHVNFDGQVNHKSFQCNGPLITNGQAHLLGDTFIKTPIFNTVPDESFIKQKLQLNGDKSITGPYVTSTGTLRFYYRFGIDSYYYTELSGTLF